MSYPHTLTRAQRESTRAAAQAKGAEIKRLLAQVAQLRREIRDLGWGSTPPDPAKAERIRAKVLRNPRVQSQCKPIKVGETRYRSINHAAECLGVQLQTVRRRLKNGTYQYA